MEAEKYQHSTVKKLQKYVILIFGSKTMMLSMFKIPFFIPGQDLLLDNAKYFMVLETAKLSCPSAPHTERENRPRPTVQ